MNARTLACLLTSALALGACTANNGGTGNDGGGNNGDGTTSDSPYGIQNDAMFNHDIQYADNPPQDTTPPPDVFFAHDPPPMYCAADGAVFTDVMVPGGTVDCPADKNIQGCPCDTAGMTAPCWTGPRVNRNHGQCHDGTTTCMQVDEVTTAWGPCNGEVLPTPGVTLGPAACGCFSSGTWAIANLSPCFVNDNGQFYAVSTYQDASGQAQCPAISGGPPFPAMPGTNWSTDSLTVDCAGQFHLCYTLKAGNANSPQPTDCVVTQVCVDTWYAQAGVSQTLPPIPSWTTTDPTCATQFNNSGGYGEMSVTGKSAECELIGAGSDMMQPYVFQRVNYCPSSCNSNPMGPGCMNCGQGGSGMF